MLTLFLLILLILLGPGYLFWLRTKRQAPAVLCDLLRNYMHPRRSGAGTQLADVR